MLGWHEENRTKIPRRLVPLELVGDDRMPEAVGSERRRTWTRSSSRFPASLGEKEGRVRTSGGRRSFGRRKEDRRWTAPCCRRGGAPVGHSAGAEEEKQGGNRGFARELLRGGGRGARRREALGWLFIAEALVHRWRCAPRPWRGSSAGLVELEAADAAG